MKKIYSLLLPVLLACTSATAQIIITVAGNGTNSFSGDGGPATAAALHTPEDMAVDNVGNIYISDHYNYRIRKVSPSGIITTIAGNGVSGYSGDGGPATTAMLKYCYGIACDNSGNVFLADDWGRVRKVNAAGIITTVAGNGTHSSTGDGGQATAAGLSGPNDIAVDAAGNLYITDDFSVRKVTAATGIITRIAGTGTGTCTPGSGHGGPATAAQLCTPKSIAVDASGNVYFTEYNSDLVRKVTPSGTIYTIAGNTIGTFSGDGGPATLASLDGPNGVAVDASGNVYIGDYHNNRVRKVTPAGIISTYAGIGSFGWSCDGCAATTSMVNSAAGVAVDNTGKLYIAANGQNRIRKIVPGVPVDSITGEAPVCIGSTITLANAVPGGVWTSTNPSVATINSSTGVVTGVSSGTTTISYTLSPAWATTYLSVGTCTIAAITGATSVCVGASTIMSNTEPGGTWSSDQPSVATIDAATGNLTGVTAGVATIWYHAPAGSATMNMLVYPCPPPPPTGIPGTAANTLDVSVFPNPGSGTFTVNVTGTGFGQASISIADIVGRKITGLQAPLNQPITISSPHLADGVYFMTVRAGDTTKTMRIVINRN